MILMLTIIASFLAILSCYIKDKNKSLKVLNTQLVLVTIYSILCGNVIGGIAASLSIARISIYFNNKLSKKIAFLLCVVGFFPLLFKEISFVEIFPPIANCCFTMILFLPQTKIIKYKLFNALGIVFLCITDLAFGLYVPVLTNILSITMCLVAVARVLNDKKKTNLVTYKTKAKLCA